MIARGNVIGHGVDLVDVPRIAQMRAEHGQTFLTRTFTARELADCDDDVRIDQRLAVRFAAKEAAMKALGTGLADGVTWQDFSIATHASGRPELVVTGRAAELAAARGIASWQVSLTHTKLLGMASVLALSA